MTRAQRIQTNIDAISTPIDVEQIKSRLLLIAPGRCRRVDTSGQPVADSGSIDSTYVPHAEWTIDEDFIAHAPADIIALIQEVGRLQIEVLTMRQWAEEAAAAENANARELKIANASLAAANEMIRRMKEDEHIRQDFMTRLQISDISDDERTICFDAHRDLVLHIAAMLLEVIGDAPNYVEQTIDIEPSTSLSFTFSDKVQMVVTTQRVGAKTPHQLRVIAEAERDEARAEVARLRTLLGLE